MQSALHFFRRSHVCVTAVHIPYIILYRGIGKKVPEIMSLLACLHIKAFIFLIICLWYVLFRFNADTLWREDSRWPCCLRHCVTSLKVAGLIPDGDAAILHWHNPSGRTMALGSTQPLTEMSTQNTSWGEGGGRQRRPVCRADNLTTFMCRLSGNLGDPTSWNPKGLSRPVTGLLYVTLIGVRDIVHLKGKLSIAYSLYSQTFKRFGTIMTILAKMDE
jgi:hypothetical protein